MLQMSTLYCENHVDYQLKTWDFAKNYHESKKNISSFEKMRANFRVNHLNSLIFQHPTVGSQ